MRLAMIMAFSTALLHAIVDLPFYILSVSWLFVVLMAFYHALGRPIRKSRRDSGEADSQNTRRRRVIQPANS